MSTGLQELPRPRRRIDITATIAALITLGRILVAGGLAYVVAFLVAAFTPIGGYSFFLIGPVAAGLVDLLPTAERRR